MSRGRKKTRKNNLVVLIVMLLFAIYSFYKESSLDDKELATKINKDSKGDIEEISADINDIENKDLMVYFIDVGQADSILIRSKNHYMLVDAGNNEDGPKLVEFFKGLNIKSFDYVVGSHPHEDHIGGLDDIIDSFKLDKFYMPYVTNVTTKTFEDVLDSLASKNLSYDTPNVGEILRLGDASIKVIHVSNDSTASDLNDTSLVLKLTYKNTCFLLTGDATSNIENQILDDDISCDVLKVAHHGSNSSSISSFLKEVNPIYAVISVGKDNSYSHPGTKTLKRLDKLGTKIYRTDKEGTIVFSTNGDGYTVTTIKTDTDGN